MGGGSNSSSNSSSTTNKTTNVSDQSYHSTSYTTVNTLDGGAIKASADVSKTALNTVSSAVKQVLSSNNDVSNHAINTSLKALSTYKDLNSSSLAFAEKVAKDAMTFSANATKPAGGVNSDLIKYGALGLGALSLAMVFKK